MVILPSLNRLALPNWSRVMRKTPIPLLRNLPANVAVVRCGLCEELVLADECCSGPMEAPICPRRAMLEQSEPQEVSAKFLVPAIATVRSLNA